MTELENFFTDNQDEWLATLPLYQRNTINALRSKGDSLDAIALHWLSASSSTTAPFSGMPPPAQTGYLEKVKAEIRAFICGDQKYEEDRKKFKDKDSPTRLMLVSGMSAAIAPHIGANATVILPTVVLILATLGKISVNAWCTT